MPSAVEALLESYPPAVRTLARAARKFVRDTVPGLDETVDNKARLLGYGYGTGYRGMVCTLILSKAGVKLGLFRGAELPDPRGLLEGSGKVHRHVPLVDAADLRRPGLKPLLTAAARAARART
jgi:hypothetical protein